MVMLISRRVGIVRLDAVISENLAQAAGSVVETGKRLPSARAATSSSPSSAALSTMRPLTSRCPPCCRWREAAAR
ncbi:hypothetical protein [Pseudomonas aeruginosa]|uniref:hypothetical protein n=1 Tax=Pseudomonas aeruginosa TaxID=287 RepID=UPI00148C112C|nr:hypothetical protein [Pseudomonas aeruginosa]